MRVPPARRGRVGAGPGGGGLPGCAVDVLHVKFLAGRSRSLRGVTRGSRRTSPRSVEIYLAARAAAEASEAGGERRRPGAPHQLTGNDRRDLGARLRPRPRRGRQGSAGRAGGRAGRQVERGVLPRHRA